MIKHNVGILQMNLTLGQKKIHSDAVTEPVEWAYLKLTMITDHYTHKLLQHVSNLTKQASFAVEGN